MPFGAVQLLPGVNSERTPTALKAGIASSQNIRFRDALVQKIGGFELFYPFNVAGIPRDLHAWEDLNATDHLLVGTTSSLGIITGPSFVDITPQQLLTNSPPQVIATMGTSIVQITDVNLGSPLTIYDSVMVNTPITVGGLIVSGLHQIIQSISTTAYLINADFTAALANSSTATLPIFVTTTSQSIVTVTFTSHYQSPGFIFTFQTATPVGGVTIVGSYPVITVADANHFTINANMLATALATVTMNNGSASYTYNIADGPQASGAGYGTGPYDVGGYGTGTTSLVQIGIPITADDWTSDNWGQIPLACPRGGGVYQFDPNGGFAQASIVVTAPPFNNGIFVSSTLQILFCWGSTADDNVGQHLDPMLIRWSDIGDYTNFATSDTNQAGEFRIPIGSVIRGGMSAQNQNLFWTDLDLWVANYAGFPLVFGFNKIGAGAGLISSHAAQQFRGNFYWMGPSNFYKYDSSGLAVLPCPMWDYVFQNINTAFVQNVRSMPNTPFNEIGWLFPSAASSNGECDSYIKMNVTDPGSPWDGGLLSRSAWIDQTVLGNPIAATPTGSIYQHEETNDAAGNPITATMTSGYFYIDEGEDFAFVDQIYPDMIWGTYGSQQTGGAQIQISFNVINYPGDTPLTYGPYLMTSSTEYISVRFRGRQMSITITSSDGGSFWRIGKCRYRFAPAGRR